MISPIGYYTNSAYTGWFKIFAHKATRFFKIRKFRKERKLYSELLQNPEHLYGILVKGEEKARVIADKVLERVRSKLGY
mgnify:CR=1 FL=1